MPRRPIGLLAAAALLMGAVSAPSFSGPTHTATVIETMDSGGYTYVKVDEGGLVYWAAAPATQVAVGDQVSFQEQMKMVNFTSSTLNRTFDELMFIGALSGGSGIAGPQAIQPVVAAVSGPIAKAEGGQTVAEVFANKTDLKGKTVRVRGKVVKVSRNIMGLNWVHLQDGTGSDGSDRIIFRSATGLADVGSIVTAEGTLDIDKDFGFGYTYSVLVDDSTFSE